jgi:hypothetical protein
VIFARWGGRKRHLHAFSEYTVFLNLLSRAGWNKSCLWSGSVLKCDYLGYDVNEKRWSWGRAMRYFFCRVRFAASLVIDDVSGGVARKGAVCACWPELCGVDGAGMYIGSRFKPGWRNWQTQRT